ncbi:hypothetical protein CEE45_12890 [Candidatus Heimdallarchaeota archaeon B3_Heim]|nr:MAG: hypothetical protein CEE45_12890 [Candidatus Heimdallarchaeota archaeon B3_Heim]
MNSWLKFLGIFLTDGSVYFSTKNRQYKVSIFQKKENFLEEIQDLLQELPFDFKHKPSKYEYYICNKRLASLLSKWKGKNKLIFPEFIHDLSISQKRIFVEWLFKGDGSFHKDGSLRYFATISINFRDNLFHLLLQLGYNFSFYKQSDKSSLSKNPIPIYRINLKKSDYYYIRKRNITTTPYDGKVYCVSVPNRVLFVERNGKFTWCGNSWQSASNPTLRDVHEYILIFSKSVYKRNKPDKSSDSITRDEFLTNTKSVWTFPTESAKRIGHPAPFPIELPYRLIQLYSFQEDIVLDPFMGSGQTAIAALKSSRRFVGYDINQDYVDLANRRVKQFKDEQSRKKLDNFLPSLSENSE